MRRVLGSISAVALAAVGTVSIALAQSADDADAVALLFASDVLRAQGQAAQDPVLLVGALALAAKARGRIYAIGGRPADIQYDERWSEAQRAVRGDPQLSASLSALPAPDRGATGGMRSDKLTLGKDGGWRGAISYDGGETALLYARTDGERPIRLVVRDARSATLCDETRATGRVMCRWLPPRTSRYTVSVNAVGVGPTAQRFDLYTN